MSALLTIAGAVLAAAAVAACGESGGLSPKPDTTATVERGDAATSQPATSAPATSAPAPDSLQAPAGVRAVGPVRSDDTYETLVARLGAGAVAYREDAFPLGEGMTRAGAIIYAGTDSALVVAFEDAAARAGIERVRVEGPGAPYEVMGLRTGMTLAEAEAANGRPFVLAGLNWDYGGRVRSWEGGRLSPSVTPAFRQTTRRRAPAAVQGDREVRSDDEAWANLGMRIGMIDVGMQ